MERKVVRKTNKRVKAKTVGEQGDLNLQSELSLVLRISCCVKTHLKGVQTTHLLQVV